VTRNGEGASSAPIALHLIIGVVCAALAGLLDALVSALGPPTGASVWQHAAAGAAVCICRLSPRRNPPG